jgi:hypothetical protein
VRNNIPLLDCNPCLLSMGVAVPTSCTHSSASRMCHMPAHLTDLASRLTKCTRSLLRLQQDVLQILQSYIAIKLLSSILIMQTSVFSRQLRLRTPIFFGMCHCVTWYLVPDVAKKHSTFILAGLCLSFLTHCGISQTPPPGTRGFVMPNNISQVAAI